jgi:hypothetical protein
MSAARAATPEDNNAAANVMTPNFVRSRMMSNPIVPNPRTILRVRARSAIAEAHARAYVRVGALAPVLRVPKSNNADVGLRMLAAAANGRRFLSPISRFGPVGV